MVVIAKCDVEFFVWDSRGVNEEAVERIEGRFVLHAVGGSWNCAIIFKLVFHEGLHFARIREIVCFRSLQNCHHVIQINADISNSFDTVVWGWSWWNWRIWRSWRSWRCWWRMCLSTAMMITSPTLLYPAWWRTAISVPSISKITLFFPDNNIISTLRKTVSTLWMKSIFVTGSAFLFWTASLTGGRARQTPLLWVKVLPFCAIDRCENFFHTEAKSVHIKTSRANTSIQFWIKHSVKSTRSASPSDLNLFALANQFTTISDLFIASPTVTGAIKNDLIERAVIAITIVINQLTRIASITTLTLPHNFSIRTMALSMIIYLTSRTLSTVAINEEASFDCRAVDTVIFGTIS